MFRTIKTIKTIKTLKRIPRLYTPLIPKKISTKTLTTGTLIGATLINASFMPFLNKQKQPTPKEIARKTLCDGLIKLSYTDALSELMPEQIPDAFLNQYINYPYKMDFIDFYAKQLRILLDRDKLTIDEAFKLLLEYNRSQHEALKTLHPSEISGLNSFELTALLETKKYGVKAEDIRDSQSIACGLTRHTFIYLIEDCHLQAKEALAEVKGLSIEKNASNDSVNRLILYAILKKYKRKDIMLLLDGKTPNEFDSDPAAKNLLKIKMNYIFTHGYDKTLFHLLAPLKEFSPLQQNVLHELHWYSNLPYKNAIHLLTTLNQDELEMYNTRKFRRGAHKKVIGATITDKDIWFNSYEHANALDMLVNKHLMRVTDAVAVLKSIPDLKQIECIAKGASVSQSAVMTKTQQRCFIDLNDSQFIYGLAPQFRLTAELALTIHMNSTGDISSSNLKAFTSARIPVADSIKLLNLMDKSAQEAMVKHPKDVISLLKPRYRDIEQPYLRREDVKRSWTEKSRNIFHPGVIISALSHNYNRNFNFANDGNPYGVSELAFHMMGLGRDFFEKVSDDKPIFNSDSVKNFEGVRQMLREQFPELAAFTDSIDKLNILRSDDEKNKILKTIEEKFGKEITIQPGLSREETLEKTSSFRM